MISGKFHLSRGGGATLSHLKLTMKKINQTFTLKNEGSPNKLIPLLNSVGVNYVNVCSGLI